MAQRGYRLFSEACKLELEGIVAKPSISPYGLLNGQSPWLNIKNPKYRPSVERAHPAGW